MMGSIQRMVVAAAICCAGNAHAATVTVPTNSDDLFNGVAVSGDTTILFSRNFTGFVDTGFGRVDPYGHVEHAIVTYPTEDEFGNPDEYTRHRLLASVNQFTFDDVTGRIESVSSTGGIVLSFPKSAATKNEGGSAKFGELEARFHGDGSASVYGVIEGQALGAANVVIYSGLLFSVAAADVIGSRDIPGNFDAGFMNELTLQHLALSDGGRDALVQSFGMASNGLLYTALNYIQPDFGDMTVRLTAMAPIPEPSSVAMFGIGLLSLVWVRRRRPSR